MTMPDKADETRRSRGPDVRRLVCAYLIGVAACSISIWAANRPQGGHWNILFEALLGMAASVADVFHKSSVNGFFVPAAAVLPLVFVLAEALRSRSSWLRWSGYAVWILLAVATFWWFLPPNI